MDYNDALQGIIKGDYTFHARFDGVDYYKPANGGYFIVINHAVQRACDTVFRFPDSFYEGSECLYHWNNDAGRFDNLNNVSINEEILNEPNDFF